MWDFDYFQQQACVKGVNLLRKQSKTEKRNSHIQFKKDESELVNLQNLIKWNRRLLKINNL